MTQSLVEMATLSPIACGSTGFSQRGRVTVTLVVKATFAMIHAGVAELAEPEPIVAAEQHHKNNPTRSIRAASDLAPYLRRAEVLFSGHACAPQAGPMPRLRVRLAVLRDMTPLVDKALLVEGDKGPDGPKPFERMPIVYERAFGGAGFADNPIGVGGPAGSDRPNVLDPRDPIKSVGFGPISRTWPARKRLLGGAERKRIEQPIAELPDTFDWAYFQSAPLDQQCDFLRGDERVVLESLHPTLPWFETRLPGARAAARVFGLPNTTGPRPVGFQLDTLFIDGDALLCSALWRATIPVADPSAVEALRVIAALEMPGQSIAWPASFAELPERATKKFEEPRTSEGGARTLMLEDQPPRLQMAGTMALDVAAPQRSKTLELPPVGRVPEAKFGVTMPLTADDDHRAAAKPAAPFASPSPDRPASAAVRDAGPQAPIFGAFSIPGAPWSVERAPKPPTVQPDVNRTLDGEAGPRPAGKLSPSARLPFPSGPDLEVGGASRPAMVVGESSPEKPPARPLSTPPPPVEAPKAAAVAAAPGRDPSSVDLEECAAIAAELSLAKTPRVEVLRGHALDEATWRKVEKRHNDAMDRDTGATGESGRSVYDVAFVSSVERVRGTLGPQDYARLLFATERGDLAGALATTGLTRAAWLRVQRVLKRRSAHDGAYGAATEHALATLRRG